MNKVFSDTLKNAPLRPGCYLFRDQSGKILYIGKARVLRNRVQVYRRAGADGRARLADLLRLASTAEFFVTDSEKEAVLLEERLVKKHQPSMNVLLKDDKSFLFIQIETQKEWPKLSLARRKAKGKGVFFGPYPSASAARRAKRLLMQAFGLRDCTDHTLRNRTRACLKHSIGMCLGPCVGLVSAEDYDFAIQGASEVLGGKVGSRVADETQAMKLASASLDYENALRSRNRIQALKALREKQKVRLATSEDFDVLGLDERGWFALLQYRGGDWVGTRRGKASLWINREDAIRQALAALYSPDSETLPPTVLVSELPEEHEEWLASEASRVSWKPLLRVPCRGEKKALLRMAESNARAMAGEKSHLDWPALALRLSELLHFPLPAVVECVDISHFQGSDRVASKVRFVEGIPEPSSYRRYLIGGGVGNDDFEAMREVVGRIVRSRERDGLADLFILDGGQLQHNAGLESLGGLAAEIQMVGLAKARKGRGPIAAEERVFLPGKRTPIILEPGSPERHFFEKIRDEAHRFAIQYHRKRREDLRLILEQVPGVGPAKRKTLLDFYQGKLERIRDASLEELAALQGLNVELAKAVQEHLEAILP